MATHRHRRSRPRYGRVAVLSVSATVTAVALLGGLGVLPSSATHPRGPGAAQPGVPVTTALSEAAYAAPPGPAADPGPEPAARTRPSQAGPEAGRASGQGSGRASEQVPVPADSGTGRRVVFSEGEQRVWLVTAGGRVERSYLVSGSLYDNLDPGTYQVYSRSEQAWGVDGSGTMRYFVRFTRGSSAAIGFHDIPVDDGVRVQSLGDLGTPQSHGCIRQRPSDARALWRFAPLGTTVVVTA